MMIETEFDFKNKFALLDTNILKFIFSEKKDARSYKSVFDFLKEKQCTPYVIKRITDFEYAGYRQSKSAYEESLRWLNEFAGLPPIPVDFELAIKLSCMYRCAHPSISPTQISFVDCLYAAQLLRVKDRAFIVTTDLNDYPSFLFDLVHCIPIEEKSGSTTFVGFKIYNEEKYNRLLSAFEKSA